MQTTCKPTPNRSRGSDPTNPFPPQALHCCLLLCDLEEMQQVGWCAKRQDAMRQSGSGTGLCAVSRFGFILQCFLTEPSPALKTLPNIQSRPYPYR
jgi:hypothetical protein